jgi:hypothetical protein
MRPSSSHLHKPPVADHVGAPRTFLHNVDNLPADPLE